MLKGITLLDMTSRLPGPLAASLLARKSARVIKVEDKNRPDPFNSSDPLFSAWYRELNRDKQIRTLDLTSAPDQKNLSDLATSAQVLLTSGKGEMWDLVSKIDLPVKVILKATKPDSEIKLLHDLNILALKKVLTLHARTSSEEVISPPFLPVGGIAFASSLAIDILGALLNFEKTKVPQIIYSSLEEAVENLLGTLCPSELTDGKRTHFLHNGSYPCYNIYKTKDGHAVAFAPIEAKLWVRFCQIFNCKIDVTKRMTSYEEDPTLIESISSLFSKLSLNEVEELLKSEPDGKDLCITPFKL